MEKFKTLDELMVMDEKHKLLGAICGVEPSLDGLHKYLNKEILNDEVPDDIKDQFNIMKNMSLYTFFFYALAPEVHLKSFTIIEYALRLKAKPKKRMMLASLIDLAIKEKWISDSGFRHIHKPTLANEWCKSMVKIIPSLRNAKAHGSTMLLGDFLHHISVCSDFINQLFPVEETKITAASDIQ